MIITPQTIIYGADKKPVKFPHRGLTRDSFNGQTIQDLRAGGHDWYLYQPPEGYDPVLNRLDGVIVLGSYTCTEGRIDLTAEELQARIDSENLSIESQRSTRYRNESDPIFFYWKRGQRTEQEWLDHVELIRTVLPYIEEGIK